MNEPSGVWWRFILGFLEDAVCSAKNDLVLLLLRGHVHVPFTVMTRGVVLAAQAFPCH